jgi:hypothetical protein
MTKQTIGVIAGRTGGAAMLGFDGGPTKIGHVNTPQGPITWTMSSDGALSAQGGGQTLASSSRSETDGSWQWHESFSRSGEAPYLTIESNGDAGARKVELTVRAGSSVVTLTVTNIDPGVRSGTATVSGSVAGSAVSGGGPVDLTSNPLVGRQVPGWPEGAFAAEIQQAGFFAPLARSLVVHTTPPHPVPPHPVSTGTDGGPVIKPMSVGGVFARAGAWCLGGAIGGSEGGPGGIAIGCVGGAVGSLVGDLVTWVDESAESGVEPDPVPPIVIHDDPEPIGPVTQTQPDDPPPPPPGDGSGGEGPTGSGGDTGDTGDGGDTSDGGNPGDSAGGAGGRPLGDDDPPLKEN